MKKKNQRNSKKQAFSLVELLAVLIILGVIALIVTPIIIKLIENAKKEAWRATAYGIVESAKMYHSDELLGVSFEEDIVFDFDEGKPEKLKFHGTVPDGGIVKVNDEGQISIAIHNNKWCATKKYSDAEVFLKRYEKETCVDAELTDDPTITLKGREEDFVGQGQLYIDPGAEAKTVGGKALDYRIEIRKDGDIVDKIDSSHIGDNYMITYIAENNHKIAFVIRTVTVIDMTPQIEFTEPNQNYVKSQNVAILVSAIRPNIISSFEYKIDDGNWIPIYSTHTVITLNTTGEHQITVKAKDNKGYTATKQSGIYKIDATGPEITIDPKEIILEPTEVENYNIFTGVSASDNIEGFIDVRNIRTSGNLSTSLGTYPITYIVSDSLGNTTTAIRTFIVKDKTKPEITILPMNSNGFVKTQLVSIQATDNIGIKSLKYILIKDGVRGNEISINSGETVSLDSSGNYEIEVIAIDNNDNVANKKSGVYKIDRINPTITVPENTVIKITEATSYDLKTGVIVSDNSGVAPTLSYEGNLSASLGTYTITYIATDEAGNVAKANRKFTVIESDGPILSFSKVDTGGSWIKGITVTVSATDQSDLSQFTYEVFRNGNSLGTTNVPVNGKSASDNIILNSDGIYKIKLYAKDIFENESTAFSVAESSNGGYWIDKTAPNTPKVEMRKGSSTGPIYTSNTWSEKKVYVILSYTGSDTSGINHYESSSNGTTWSKMSSNILVVDKEGITNLYFRAVDKAGNTSDSTGQYIVKVDTVKPDIPTMKYEKSKSKKSYTPGSWSNESVNVTMSYSGIDTSGIDHYEISIDGSTWKEYSSFVANDGDKTYRFRAVDKAGNIGTISNNVSIKVDTFTPAPPKLTYRIGSTSGATYEPGTWSTKIVYVTLRDGGSSTSKLSHYEYSTNKGSTWTKISGNSVSFNKEGQTTVRFRAVNNAGTEGTWTANPSSGTIWVVGDALIKIDTVPPTAPTVAFHKNSTSGPTYTPGTATNTSVYAVLTYNKTDTSGFAKNKFQSNLASNGSKWMDVASNYIGWTATTWKGTAKVKFRVVDGAGNFGKETSTYTVIIQ